MLLVGMAENWPTPQNRDWRGPDLEGSGNLERKRERGFTEDLNSRAANWATPAARDWKSDCPNQSPDHAPPLGRQVLQETGAGFLSGSIPRWPTPTARNDKGDRTSTAKKQEHKGRGNSSKDLAVDAALHNNPKKQNRRLNPAFVEWLMGFPPNWTLPSDTAPTDCEP
jgi:hypothetical protein